MTAGSRSLEAGFSGIRRRFREKLHSLWRQEGAKPRLGLAISGGVDSMALAFLCSDAIKTFDRGPSLTGFIVDHKLRDGSAEEARNVASQLGKLNIRPEVLTLDWTQYGDPAKLTNLESIARRLRYQALGKASKDARIRSLLVAHHGDDQAETVLQRVLGGYLGTGLRGMVPVRPIPECGTTYGICASGMFQSDLPHDTDQKRSPAWHTPVDSGGVNIIRPLLAFTKDELVSVCQSAGVSWFEDHTNTDRTYTLRNTVRHLLKTDTFPRALQSAELVELTNSMTKRESNLEQIAEECIRQTPVQFDPSSGIVSFILPSSYPALPAEPDIAYHIKTLIVRRLVSLVAPRHDIQLQDLHEATNTVFGAHVADNTDTQESLTCTVVGALVRASNDEQGTLRYRVQRSPPTPEDRKKAEIKADLKPRGRPDSRRSASEWHLWDGRYWLRVLAWDMRAPSKGIKVRFLSVDHLAAARRSLDDTQRERLDLYLKAAPGSARYTLPAIFEETPIGDGEASEETLVALPSLNWSRTRRWGRWRGQDFAQRQKGGKCFWEIRYKSIRFRVTRMHTLADRDHSSVLMRRIALTPQNLENDTDGVLANAVLLHGQGENQEGDEDEDDEIN